MKQKPSLPQIPLPHSGSLLVCLVLVFVAAAQIAAFYPGYLSHDSAYQWWQARTGEITTLWPPGMALLLRLFEPLPGTAPSALFVLHVALYWACVAYVVLRQSRWDSRAISLIIFFVFPIVTVCLPHVWTDVSLAISLLCACVLLDMSSNVALTTIRSRALVAFAVFILIGCTLLRHNAWCALPPLCWWAASNWLRRIGDDRPTQLRSTAALASLIFAVAIVVYASVPRWVSKVHADTWAITAIWDLQMLSVATGKVLIPKSISNDATISDLQHSLDPLNAVTLYVKSTSQWANSTTGLTASERSDLISAWIQAVRQAPIIYLKHRTHVFMKMLGPKRVNGIDGGADEPILLQFRDNPPTHFANPSALQWARSWVDWLKPQWWASPLVWISVSSLAILIWTRSESAHARYVWLSGMLYLLPLYFLSPTADLRYVLWPTIASAVAALLSAPKRQASHRGVANPIAL